MKKEKREGGKKVKERIKRWSSLRFEKDCDRNEI